MRGFICILPFSSCVGRDLVGIIVVKVGVELNIGMCTSKVHLSGGLIILHRGTKVNVENDKQLGDINVVACDRTRGSFRF